MLLLKHLEILHIVTNYLPLIFFVVSTISSADILNALHRLFDEQVQPDAFPLPVLAEKNHLHLTPDDPITLFVNGYRFTQELFTADKELPDSENNIFVEDVFGYWQQMDDLFLSHCKSKVAYYADAHFSIQTSNHKSIERILKSFVSYLQVSNGNSSALIFNTQSNIEGFLFRYAEGIKAGITFEQKIMQARKSDTKNILLHLVAHSMGYAYCLGIIDHLKKNPRIQFLQFFVLAPENASAKSVPHQLFQSVQQYGSKDISANAKDNLRLDGLAPQTSIFSKETIYSTQYKRNFIPDNQACQGFVESHLLKNYTWIF